MAKSPAAEAAPETEVVTESAAAPADGRSIIVTVPANPSHPYSVDGFKEALTGETKSQPRAEFIREYANTGKYTRSDLTSLTRLASGLAADDKKLKYQIIFQATKTIDKAVWPQKVEAAPATEAASEEAAA